MVKLTQTGPRTAAGRFDGDAWLAQLSTAQPEHDHALLSRAMRLVVERTGDDGGALLSSVEFADLLFDVRMDSTSVASGLLFRSVRTGYCSTQDVQREVDPDVAELIGGVERVGTVSLLELSNAPLLATDNRDQVDNVRRMLVAMIDDVRVAIVKLAERIIALRLLKNAPYQRQRQVANEVLVVFGPLANRLGIWRLKWQLEDLAFRYENPSEYRHIASRLDGKRIEREANVSEVGAVLEAALGAEGIKAEIHGRAKHIYSIWRKMRAKHIDFDQVYDIRALRVVVADTRACYAALGVVHTHWRHIPHEFDDYIANPKDNGYRSIHTAVVGPDGRTVEIQIRTREMHNDAELGVCAHWAYKHEPARGDASYAEKLSWLRQVLEWHEEVGGFAHVGREIRSNIEDARIFVATPGGHVVDLPDGATPLDFAFRVHTDVGLHCAAARVDGAMVPLNTALITGQRVEIDTDPGVTPNREWLNHDRGYVRTPRARAKLQAWFRALPAQQNVDAGRAVLQQAFARLAIVEDFDALAARLGLANGDRLAFAVAVGERQLIDVIAAMAPMRAGELTNPVELEVSCTDRSGMLHDLTAVLAERRLSLASIEAKIDAVSNTATIRLGVEVDGLAELARLADQLQHVSGVISLRRLTRAPDSAVPRG